MKRGVSGIGEGLSSQRARLRAGPICASWILAASFLLFASKPSLAQQEFDLDRAYRAAYQDLMENPADRGTIWRFVRAAKAVQNYEAAIGVLEPVLLIDADQPLVRSELGLLYYRLASYDAAREHLKASLAGGRLTENRETLVRSVLARAEKKTQDNRFRGALTFGGRFQSNPSAEPDGGITTVNGNEVILNAVFDREDDGNVFLSAWAIHEYDLGLQNEFSLDTRGGFYATRQFSADETNVVTGTLEPGFSFRPFRRSAPWFKVRPHAVGNLLTIADHMVALSFGGGIDLRAEFKDGVRAWAKYQFRQRDFFADSLRPTLEARDGYENHFRLGLKYPVYRWLNVRVKTGAIQTEADAARHNNWNYSVAGDISIHYPPPVNIGDANWRAWVRVDQEFTDFSSVDPALSTTEERLDKQFTFGIGNSANVYRNVDLNLEYSLQDQTSNFDQFEFTNHSGIASVTLRY